MDNRTLYMNKKKSVKSTHHSIHHNKLINFVVYIVPVILNTLMIRKSTLVPSKNTRLFHLQNKENDWIMMTPILMTQRKVHLQSTAAYLPRHIWIGSSAREVGEEKGESFLNNPQETYIPGHRRNKQDCINEFFPLNSIWAPDCTIVLTLSFGISELHFTGNSDVTEK